MKKLKTVTTALLLIGSISLLVSCSSDQSMKQFKESEMPPRVEETVKPTETPKVETGHGDDGVQEAGASQPRLTDAEDYIKWYEETYGTGGQMPGETEPPAPIESNEPEPVESVAPVESKAPEKDTPPSDVSGTDTSTTDSSVQADLERIFGETVEPKMDGGVGTSTITKEEHDQQQAALEAAGAGWE